MEFIGLFSELFTDLTPKNQKYIIEIMKNIHRYREFGDDFCNIDYRKLYFDTIFDVAKITDSLINLQQRMEEIHMRTEEKGTVIDLTDSKSFEGKNVEMSNEEKIREEAYEKAFEQAFDAEYTRRLEGGEEADTARENAKLFAKDCADAAATEAVNNHRILPEEQ